MVAVRNRSAGWKGGGVGGRYELAWTSMMVYHRLSWKILEYPRLLKVADLSYFYILFTDRLTD